MLFEIKRWDNGQVIHKIEADTLGKAVELLVAQSANLQSANLQSANLQYANLQSANPQSANLQSANLQYANLQYADLQYADLQYANLQSANLQSANLQYANLRYANLRYANLQYANLRYANLQSANLQSANLQYANLQYANLQSANLQYANLQSIKNDLWAVLCMQPLEVSGLRQSLIDGKVDGSTYEGECACLVGTIANVAKCHYEALPHLKPDSSRPIEMFFCSINKGDTPESNQCSKIALEWIDEWVACVYGAVEPKPAKMEGVTNGN